MKARLLFVDDDDTFRSVLHRELQGLGYDVESVADAEQALEYLKENRVDTVLLDLRLPGMDGLGFLRKVEELHSQLPVILLTGHGWFPDAVAAMRAGAYDFLVKPTPLEQLKLALDRAIEHGALRRQNRLLRELASRQVATEILGESSAIQDLRSSIARVAPSDANVLIEGESGTGKELVARAIHDASPRHRAAFVVVNCPAIPAELFESELFGHSRGAFTGAGRKRLGLFALADGGTLFLDEVGELPSSLQPGLLRAVQFGEYRPVGGEHNEQSDVRILAATNRGLSDTVSEGAFREDLYHRLAALTIHLPPLRERGDDVLLLAQNLLAAHNESQPTEEPKRFSESACERLRAQKWTGNVRELQNVVIRLVTLTEGNTIEGDDVDGQVLPISRRVEQSLPTLDLETLERSAVVHSLQCHAGNRGRAAAALGVATKTLYNKIRHHGISSAEWGGES